MAEFGEQLRKAREQKGYTQQSLAEKVYVTRQTVSRWEGGERYPDLITVKKISQVLDVDVGFLLSDDETNLIAERNPVVEKASVNNITLVLFAGIVISYIISVVGLILRIPSLTPIPSSDLLIVGCNAIGEIIGIIAFTVGFVWVMKFSFSPKKVGGVMMAFFASNCIKDISAFFSKAKAENPLFSVLIIAISVMGIIASYFCFVSRKKLNIRYSIIKIIAVLGIIRTIFTLVSYSALAGNFVSADIAVNSVLSICIYILLCYQAHVLEIKEKSA